MVKKKKAIYYCGFLGSQSLPFCLNYNVQQVEDVLQEEKYLDFLQDATKNLNGDESGSQLCPNTGKAVACKGNRSVYEYDRGPAKASVTALFAFYVSGTICPRMVTYPHRRLPSDITQTVPGDCEAGHSPTDGCQQKSCASILEVFSLHILQNPCQVPVILIFTGHRTHPPCHLSELSSELDIILVSPHPNTVRLLQPMNVATFKPLKMGQKTAVQDWHKQTPDKILNKEWFSPVLGGAL